MKIIEDKYSKDIMLNDLNYYYGYKVMIPQFFYNQISFLRNGCQLWIEKDDNCWIIVEIDNEGAWETELTEFIKRSLSQRKGTVPIRLSQTDLSIYESIRSKIVLDLSGKLVNEQGCVSTIILTINENTPDELAEILELNNTDIFHSKEVRFEKITNDTETIELLRWILDDRFTQKFRGDILWCRINDIKYDVTKYGFIKQGDFAFLQIE